MSDKQNSSSAIIDAEGSANDVSGDNADKNDFSENIEPSSVNPDKRSAERIMRFALLASIFIALISWIVIVFVSSDEEDVRNQINFMDKSSPLAGGADSGADEGGKDIQNAISPVGHGLATSESVAIIQEELVGLSSNYAALSQRFDALSMAFTTHGKTIDDLQVGLHEIIDTRMPTLAAADKALELQLANILSLTNENKNRIRDAKNQIHESPPFSLTSIDEWGAVISATLHVNGKSSIVSVGDVFGAWQITRIERPCIHVKRSPKSSDIEICIPGSLR